MRLRGPARAKLGNLPDRNVGTPPPGRPPSSPREIRAHPSRFPPPNPIPTRPPFRRIIIALDLDILGTERDITGKPVSVESAANAGATAPPPAAAAGAPPGPSYGAGGNYGGAPGAGSYGQQPNGNAYGNGNGNGNRNAYGNGNGTAYGGSYGNGGQYGGAPGGGGGGGYGQSGGGGGYGAPPPSYGGHGAVSRNAAPARISPISSLNPYQNRWTIRARVTNQPTLRSYHNARGDGKVLNVDLLDAEGGEIKAVCFGDAAERFAELFQAGRVYDISKGQMQAVRNRQYSNHEFEIRLDHNAQVEECADAAAAAKIKKIHYAFKKIADVEQIAQGAMVDVVAVVHSVGDLTTILKRDGSETSKRSVVLRDDSGASIELTMWAPQSVDVGGKLEQMTSAGEHPILAIKNGRVGEFQGKNIGTVGSSHLDINPDVSEGAALRHWYDEGGGATAEVRAFSGVGGGGGGGRDRCVTIAQLKEEIQQLGATPAFWVQCRCHVTYLKANDEGPFYPACPLKNGERMCQKKLPQRGPPPASRPPAPTVR